tara:strand:+ start:707 stop:1696 length:990 start_codon:yes stop_codon:yes gene_type:complete
MLGIAIPAYKVSRNIKDTINQLLIDLRFIEFLAVIVEDGCPENSASYLENNDKRIHIIKSEHNYGVGYSTLKGFNYLMKFNCTSLLKFDADGQHNSKHIRDVYALSEKLRNNIEFKPFLIKGSRYEALSRGGVPIARRIGSMFIEPMARSAINYRNLSDIGNGMISLTKESYCIMIKRHKINIEDRYLFESSIIANAGLLNFEIYEFTMDRIYNKSIKSNMNEFKLIPSMLNLWIKTYFLRITENSFLKLGIRSLLLLISLLSFFFSSVNYIFVIREINKLGNFITAGTAALQLFFVICFLISTTLFFVSDYIKSQKTKKFITKNIYIE